MDDIWTNLEKAVNDAGSDDPLNRQQAFEAILKVVRTTQFREENIADLLRIGRGLNNVSYQHLDNCGDTRRNPEPRHVSLAKDYLVAECRAARLAGQVNEELLD